MVSLVYGFLLNTGHPLARTFLQHVRSYNNALSFTSLGVKVDAISHTRGVPVFKIQGQLHHFIGTLLPLPGQDVQFLQTYVCDNSFSTRTNPQGLNVELLMELKDLLMRINAFAQAFATAGERLQQQSQDWVQLVLSTLDPTNKDPRRYNRPRAAEVAMIYPAFELGVATRRDIVIQDRSASRSLHRVDETKPAYLPLRYPLILPYGTYGWSDSVLLGRYMGYILDPVEGNGVYIMIMEQAFTDICRSKTDSSSLACFSSSYTSTPTITFTPPLWLSLPGMACRCVCGCGTTYFGVVSPKSERTTI